MAAQPDITLDELRARLAAASITVGRTSIHRFLRSLGLTRKKQTLHASEQSQPDVATARASWRAGQPALNPAHLIFGALHH